MNSTPILPQGAAFDQHSLDGLKREVSHDSSPAGLKAAARQLEGLFVQMMLKSMREALFKDGLFTSTQSGMFTSMYDQQIAQNVADTGKLGFADLMTARLSGGHSSPAVAPKIFSVRSGFQQAVGYMPSSGPVSEPGPSQPVMPSDNKASFISRLIHPALDVARRSGISHKLLIAQAALESGWGQREIPTENGKPSHNLFGIKASPDWQGETTEITTTEYVNGEPHKTKDRFKVYPSYAAALADYTSLLLNNHRYQQVLNASSPEKAARALQFAGYATDPAYAKKLIGIIQQISSGMANAAKMYSTDLSTLF